MAVTNPLLEVNPAACLFVVGPQLTATAQDGMTAQTLSYRSIIEAGLSTLQTSTVYSSKEQRLKDIRSIKDEARKNLILAMQKIIHIMKQQGCYEKWLQKTFCSQEEAAVDVTVENSSIPESVSHLLSLQSQGAMLACTQYDTVLDGMANSKPFTLQEIKEWEGNHRLSSKRNSSSRKQLEGTVTDEYQPSASHGGFLHLNGVFTTPESVHLADSELDPLVCKQLREIFQRKLVIFLGFDGDSMDPLLPAFLDNLFLETEPGSLRNPPILLTSRPSRTATAGSRRSSNMTTSSSSSSRHTFNIPVKFLQLRIHEQEVHQLAGVISAGSTKNFTVGRGHTEKQSDGMKVQAFLLFNEKQSFRKLGDVIYQQSKSGEIYVRRDALTVIFDNNQILYGNLVTYGGNGLRQLWDLVFSEESTLLGKGLVGFGLQNAAIIWTRRKPAGLGNVTGINSVHTYAAHKALHTLTLAQQCGMSDSKSPILIPVSTPPSNTDTRQSSSSPSPVDPPTTRPSHLKMSSTPPVLQGGQSKIRTPVISPPIATLVNPTPFTASLFPAVRTPVSMSPVTGPGLPLAVNPIHNPFMTGLTRFTTPRGMFPPMLISAKNPLLSTSALQSSGHTPGVAGSQTPSVKVSSDLSTHLQMVLHLQNAQLNALSSTANLPTSHDPLVSQAIEKASYILKYRSNPPIYCIAPPEEIMPLPPLSHNDPSLYEHTIEYIDTLSSSYNASEREEGNKERRKKVSVMNVSSRKDAESHGASTSSETIPSSQETTQQTSRRQETDEQTLQAPVVSDHESVELDEEESARHRQLRHNEEIRSTSQQFSRQRAKTSRRISPPPLLRIPQDADINKTKFTPSSNVATTSPFSSAMKTRSVIGTPTLPKTVTTPTFLSSMATTTQTGLFKTLKNNNNMSPSFSPAAVMATPSLVSLAPGVAGYCVMMNPLTGLPVPPQPTMVLPTASLGTAGATALQPQLPLLIPAVNQPAAVPVVAGGFNSQQMVYYVMGTDNSTFKTQQQTSRSSPPYMSVQQSQQELKHSNSLRVITPNTPPSLISTGSTTTTTKSIPPLKRTSPDSGLLDPPKSKHKKLVDESHHRPSPNHCSHTTDRDPGRLNSKCESHDTQHRSHVVRHRSHDMQSRSHDTQSRSHDTRCASNSSMESIEVERNIDHVTSHSSSEVLVGTGQCVYEDDNAMVTETMVTESEDTEGEEKTVITDTSHTRQQLTLTTNSYSKPHIQLWEFLLQLLLTPDHGAIIQWTGNSYEFSIINPDAVARLWGSCKNKPRMTYEKLSRALRYYYSRGILDKVTNKRLTFRFSFDVHKYIVERNKAANFSLDNHIT